VILEVTLYTREHCEMCDEAASALEAMRPFFGFTLVTRDIDEDADLLAAYDARVPVVVAGDRIIAEAPIDSAVLRLALEAALGG
jgi:glutaredoxin